MHALIRTYGNLRDAFVRANFSQPMPSEELAVLRRIELLLLTPLRITVGILVFLAVEAILAEMLKDGSVLTFVVVILWYVIVSLYLFYVASGAILAATSPGGPAFDDAIKLRGLYRRLRNRFRRL